MKIILIGPGGTSIPPYGWGAVESIVWDYYTELSKRGHHVIIINEPYYQYIIDQTNGENPDVVYIMFDDHIGIAPQIRCSRIFYTSHYAYITQEGFEEKQRGYYNGFFKQVIENQNYIVLNAISEEVLNVYIRNGFKGRSNIIHNGARADEFHYLESPIYPEKSIYVGKIEHRKSQYKYQRIEGVEFAGNYYDSPFDVSCPNYLGEWSKPDLYAKLTRYANLILLSDGEADPLVVKEALVAGLGVVVSECASANLDRSKPFITVIPNDRLNDIPFVTEQIKSNREMSVQMRSQIREYGETEFAWSTVVDRFLQKIPLKIALIGPGIMPIPPPGWGAVEIIIWDYYNELTRLGHKVDIINTPDTIEIVLRVNAGRYDFVHLHYDVFWSIVDYLQCPKIAITSHYPYIDQPEKHEGDGYSPIFSFLTNQTKYMNFVLSEKDYSAFLRCGGSNLYKMKNGIDSVSFRFSETCDVKRKTIYLGKISGRKNQAKYQGVSDIDFVGRCEDDRFDTTKPNYLGEWSREQIHENLTDYANLVLLSQGEADPLVVKEALIAGLGVVVNRSSGENLDISRDFITIIEDNKMDDLEYIHEKIKENREISIQKRVEIREYGVAMFDIRKEVERYIGTIH